MRRLFTSILLIGSATLASCSSGDPEEQKSEGISSTQQAVVGSCTSFTFGMPCDPDGPLGSKLECEGVCAFGGANGDPFCTTIQVGSNNGKACGTVGGVGNGACSNRCQNGACVNLDAPSGVACRPTSLSSMCDGACDGSGLCLPVLTTCKYGKDNCKVDACNPLVVSQCISANVFPNSACDDGNECTIGDKCNATGICFAGAPKVCNDNNVCTSDSCNPNNGACIGTNIPGSCEDGNPCTVNDSCSNGGCKAGGPNACDDNNPCTADSCSAATGCKHTPINCNDSNACTTDGCNTNTGACTHAAVNCNDNNVCTQDSCVDATGCSHAPIVGCGVDSGTGGSAGAGGSGGTGGAAGSGGSTGGAAGSGGTAGTGTGGVAGSSTGGTAGTATGGAAGSSTGGTAGTATGGAAGSSTGGSGGSGGSTGGTGGSTTGGSGGSTTGGTSSGGTGGGIQDAGTDGGKKPSGIETEDDGGCGCQTPGQSPAAPGGLFLVALAALGLRGRRRS